MKGDWFMKKYAVDKLLEIEEALRLDEGYQHLMAEHHSMNARFLALLEELEEEQQILREGYAQQPVELLSLDEARKRKPRLYD